MVQSRKQRSGKTTRRSIELPHANFSERGHFDSGWVFQCRLPSFIHAARHPPPSSFLHQLKHTLLSDVSFFLKPKRCRRVQALLLCMCYLISVCERERERKGRWVRAGLFLVCLAVLLMYFSLGLASVAFFSLSAGVTTNCRATFY